ncbi:NACHT domain-containing protein [Saccharopolyspora sp. 5N102]|uniref:NACHT domain-containing protein n=1 Tax=Saccharopolyspora sp. 5N102 TaxID=3375155 RepID=UPI00379A4720
MKGEAGSGKTTLLQWLAVKCAQGTLESSLAPWNGLVPFFVQLRKFAGRQLPSPGELLNTVAWQLRDRMPSGWAYDVLKSGRGLVLVDGLDEVSARDRDAVREWLSDFAGTFPNCRYVVTSRPPAVSEGWLDDESYLVAELQPMSRSRTRAFIRHWHEAVAADHPADEHAEVEAYESTLIAAIDASQALRNLTTNPLLCALVCALNYDRRTQLPRERMELYRTALEMLLSRRDIERRVPDAESAVSLSLSEKMLLLEDLAHWFTINELTVADSVRLVRRLGECLRSTRSRELDAEQVFQHLLLRSGLLREHSAGQVDFLHKTFQEYLAAKRIVDTDSIEMLIKQADNDTYGEVIVMAVGHARPGEREKLLDGLLNASEEAAGADGDRRARLQLLAVSCLEAATQLEPSLHRRITDCLRQLIPPKSAAEARSLAAMGKDVLPLLRVSDAMKPHEAAATALTAGLVGGAEALPILAELAKDRRGLVFQEVVNAWSYFDPVHFAREVLADAPLSGRSMLINDASVLVGLPHVPQITDVDCRLDGATRPSDLQLLKNTPSLRSLRMSGNDRLRDLGFLHGHPNLSLLELSDCPLLADFSALRDLPELLSVSLKGCGGTPDIETIIGCERLVGVGIEGVSASDAARLLRTRPSVVRLAIRRCQHIRELSELGSSASLRELSLDASRTLESLAGADRFPALRRLELIDCPRLRSLGHHLESTSLESLSLRWCPDIRSLDEVASLRELKELNLFGLNAYDLSPLAGLRSLVKLSVVDCEWLDDLSPLADVPALQMLDVSRSGRRLDLNALRGKRNLVVYHSGNVYNADRLGEHSQVHPSIGKR